MPEMPGLTLPNYNLYYAAPVKMLETPEGGVVAWRLTTTSGAWQPANDVIHDILFAVGGDVFSLTVDDFVQRTEAYRARYGLGSDAVAALYETVDGIIAAAQEQDRRLTPAEVALVRNIRKRTYRMFEEKLRAEGNPAADPDLLDREGGAP